MPAFPKTLKLDDLLKSQNSQRPRIGLSAELEQKRALEQARKLKHRYLRLIKEAGFTYREYNHFSVRELFEYIDESIKMNREGKRK